MVNIFSSLHAEVSKAKHPIQMYASHLDTNAVTITSDRLKDVWKGIEGINTSQPTHGPPSSDYGFNTLEVTDTLP